MQGTHKSVRMGRTLQWWAIERRARLQVTSAAVVQLAGNATDLSLMYLNSQVRICNYSRVISTLTYTSWI